MPALEDEQAQAQRLVVDSYHGEVSWARDLDELVGGAITSLTNSARRRTGRGDLLGVAEPG